MEKQNTKTKKILIITLTCTIFVVSIIAGFLIFNESDDIEKELLSDDETTSETDKKTLFKVVLEMVPTIGLEPTTYALRMRCSTR